MALLREKIALALAETGKVSNHLVRAGAQMGDVEVVSHQQTWKGTQELALLHDACDSGLREVEALYRYSSTMVPCPFLSFMEAKRLPRQRMVYLLMKMAVASQELRVAR